MRMMHLTLAVIVGFGLFACAGDDENAEPVQAETGENLDVAPSTEEEAPAPQEDTPVEDAELTVPAEGELPKDGEGVPNGETEAAANDDSMSMYNEPPLPADDTVEDAPVPSTENSELAANSDEPEQAPNSAPVPPVEQDSTMPFSGFVQSPGAKWKPYGSSEVATKVGTYTVRPGDTLAAISQKLYGTTKKFQKLASENGLKEPYVLYPGQTLSYSGSIKTANQGYVGKSSVADKAATANPNAKLTVQPGDTLWRLAEKHLGSPYAWRQFVDWNPGVLSNPNRIEPGMTLTFAPGDATLPSSSQAKGKEVILQPAKADKKSAAKKKASTSGGSVNFKVSAPKATKPALGKAQSPESPVKQASPAKEPAAEASLPAETNSKEASPTEEPLAPDEPFNEETPLPEDVYEEEEAE